MQSEALRTSCPGEGPATDGPQRPAVGAPAVASWRCHGGSLHASPRHTRSLPGSLLHPLEAPGSGKSMSGWFGRRAAPPAAPEQPASGSSGQGVPLELIRYDQATGKFELGQEALAVLKRTRGPVGVVAVCGRARQVRRRGPPSPAAAAAGNATGATAACAAGGLCASPLCTIPWPSTTQGKSFILNQLLGRSGGFQVAPTHRPCTKGALCGVEAVGGVAMPGSLGSTSIASCPPCGC